MLNPTRHLSWHPGPDPNDDPDRWGPLCRTAEKPFAINYNVALVECPDCMKILWSKSYTGYLHKKTKTEW